jgi:putative transcriptional regulator
MGLVINKPLALTLNELLVRTDLKAIDDIASVKVLEGGPMDRQRGFILHTADVSFESSAIVADNLRLSTARDALAAIARGQGPAQYLIATGYAGWGPGQLEDEIVDNAWLSCPSDLQIIFEEPYNSRVTKAANNIGINFSLMSARAGHD